VNLPGWKGFPITLLNPAVWCIRLHFGNNRQNPFSQPGSGLEEPQTQPVPTAGCRVLRRAQSDRVKAGESFSVPSVPSNLLPWDFCVQQSLSLKLARTAEHEQLPKRSVTMAILFGFVV
jgi:hypothetical protein